jgi:hypothetical protein
MPLTIVVITDVVTTHLSQCQIRHGQRTGRRRLSWAPLTRAGSLVQEGFLAPNAGQSLTWASVARFWPILMSMGGNYVSLRRSWVPL